MKKSIPVYVCALCCLLFLAQCKKESINILKPPAQDTKSEYSCSAIDTNLIRDKLWYQLSPNPSSSYVQYKSDRKYTVQPGNLYDCGPWGWMDDCVLYSEATAGYRYDRYEYKVLQLRENYLKILVIRSDTSPQIVGMIFELDNSPH